VIGVAAYGRDDNVQARDINQVYTLAEHQQIEPSALKQDALRSA